MTDSTKATEPVECFEIKREAFDAMQLTTSSGVVLIQLKAISDFMIDMPADLQELYSKFFWAMDNYFEALPDVVPEEERE